MINQKYNKSDHLAIGIMSIGGCRLKDIFQNIISRIIIIENIIIFGMRIMRAEAYKEN